MNISDLEQIVISALEDIKARDIEVIDTSRLTSQFERIIVASGDSGRQTRALAHNVLDRAHAAGTKVLGIEGEENGEWVLVDLGEIVVHVMQPAIRAYYRLEELWTTALPHRTATNATGA
ncbi:MAG: ribosome silencing factor [Proteobacteria bacterium]|jgi:ribosome-associated protein|nr:ribosome silencing factor [Pseudomonadota bacterium]